MELVCAQVKRAGIGVICADCLVLVWIGLTSGIHTSALLGALFGSVFALANLFVLGMTVCRAVFMSPSRAQRALCISYFVRYLLLGIMIYCALTAPYLHPVAAIVPLFVPKLVLQVSGILKK